MDATRVSQRIDKYWKEKVEKVVAISKKYKFEEQNVEFWVRQPAGVISLIVEIESNCEGYIKMFDALQIGEEKWLN
jgi:hypothetical protein